MNFETATIEMTKKGNLRINAKKYMAVRGGDGCWGCVLNPAPSCRGACCTVASRLDRGLSPEPVIFVRKPKTAVAGQA